LGGKCRYFKAKINHRYALFEVLMGCLFALSYLYLPLGVVELAIWYVILALFMGLFLTDLYYRKLPFVQVVVLTILCSIFMVLTEVIIEQKMYSLVLLDHLWSLIPLTGLFGIVFVLSRGKLIGGGDVLLGIPIAILLSWQGVLAVLLLASVLAVLFYIPLLSMKKIKPNTKLPFGSFLIVATLIVFFVVKLFVNFF
jgi:prepilin signal peptidase PulO-like enzyme (type II secretory pathway)